MTHEVSKRLTDSVDAIIELIREKKGADIVVIDTSKVSSIADRFIIATGSASVHVKAIADEVREKMKNDHDLAPVHIEGYEAEKWILIDYFDIIVHIFDTVTRKYYALEDLWKDAPIRRVEEDRKEIENHV